MDNEHIEGTVRKILGNVVYAGIGAGADEILIACTVRGRLRLGTSGDRTLVCVGDHVRVRTAADGTGAIEEIFPRATLLARKWTQNAELADPVVANAETLAVIVSVSPPVAPGIIDRYLVAAVAGGLDAIIVLNKIDLPEAAEERGKLDLYRSLGCRVVETSVKTGAGIDELEALIAGRISIFAGHSGVGKSSILNRLFTFDIRVGAVAAKTMKGRQTTTHIQMYAAPGGGWVIDTPGINSFGVAGVHSENLIEHFPELYALSRKCGYRDCSHIGAQTGCAILDAVRGGAILASRYESWVNQKAELEAAEVY